MRVEYRKAFLVQWVDDGEIYSKIFVALTDRDIINKYPELKYKTITPLSFDKYRPTAVEIINRPKKK